MEEKILSGRKNGMLVLLGTILVLALLALILQGKELTDYVVDNRGIH